MSEKTKKILSLEVAYKGIVGEIVNQATVIVNEYGMDLGPDSSGNKYRSATLLARNTTPTNEVPGISPIHITIPIGINSKDHAWLMQAWFGDDKDSSSYEVMVYKGIGYGDEGCIMKIPRGETVSLLDYFNPKYQMNYEEAEEFNSELTILLQNVGVDYIPSN